jgi:hypothetical protein
MSAGWLGLLSGHRSLVTQPEIVSRAERIRHDVRRKRFPLREGDGRRRMTGSAKSAGPCAQTPCAAASCPAGVWVRDWWTQLVWHRPHGLGG